MTLISGYNNDTTPSLSDKLLGTDGTNGGTINILVEDVLKLINGVSGKDYIQYKFSLTNHSNEGYFNTNESKTNPAEISKFFFNKQSTTKEDLTVLFTKLDTLQNIVISLRNPENTNNFATFKITNITINTTYFVFDVVLYKNFYSGDLVVGTIYSAYFDVKENFEDKTDKGGYEGTAQDLDDAKQNISQKGIADGYASLDVNGLVPASQLPSYVDDVLEFANLAAFPVTGATGKIYIAIDSSLIYRWSGTIYIEIKDTSAVWGAITGTVTNQTDLINWINLNVVAATFLGTIIPTDMPTGSGSAYWLATQAGTYTNFGGVVVNANSFAIISRSDSGAFSISQTELDITSKVNVSDVINTLTSTSTVNPLSGLQGKVLNEKILSNTNILNKKVDLVPVKNLFDKSKATIGSYTNNIGGVVTNASYDYSDFIPVVAGTQYVSTSFIRFSCYYDFNYAVVAGGISADIKTFTPPINAVYTKISYYHNNIDIFQLEIGSVSTSYEAYKLTANPNQLTLSDYAKKADIPSYVADKVSLVPSSNFFNKNSGLVELGYYVSAGTGGHNASASYAATGKMKIPDGATQITMTYKHQIAFFNSSGVYISGSLSTDTNKTQSVPVGAVYVDCTVLYAGIDLFMISVGTSTPINYMAYKPIISPNNLEIYASQIINDGTFLAADTFKLFLPKEVCVAVGRTIELYNSQVSWCGNINDYHFLWSGIGKSMKRKWSLTGTTIGTNNLTLKVYNKNNVLIATKTTTVKVVSATISAPFSVCPIGDSLTNAKAWQPELISLSGGSISLKGTRGSIISGVQRTHEGRSGATSAYYLGNNSYTFDSNGTVGNDGRTQDSNPFWNPATSDVDFAYYKSNYNQNPDKLLIWLGTNGIAVDATTNATNIKTFIDKVRLTGGSTIPVFVVHTLFRGNQDGIGVQTGSDGYVANSTYKLEEDLKVFNLQEKILADLSAYSNLYLIPVSTCHDSEFNFGAVSTPVNPRASQVEYLPSEATHPQNQGYMQIADIIFSSLAANQ